ncbi:von Willebrand factor A domain-containing protein [Acrasis kona]|uniref:von Willebrand factor A domain-containing protein n=1 Tax=Acrasis kona TaxID=1008807 RepID=A0AAW2YVK3_9EUKA
MVIQPSNLLSNDIAPISTQVQFAGLVACTTGYCKHSTANVDSPTGLIILDVDATNCITDRFQYMIRTTDSSAVTSIATVHVSYKNCVCRSAIDLYFIIDNSASMGATNWELLRTFTLNVTNRLVISSNNMNVGIMDFGNYGNSILSLSSNATAVKNAILGIKYRGEHTATKSGLYAAVQDITGQHPNNKSTTGADGLQLTPRGRINVPKVLLLLTDGVPDIPFANVLQPPTNVYPDCQSLYNDGSLNPVNCSQGVFAQMSGLNPSMCSLTNNSGLPCSDPTGYTGQINSWIDAPSSAYGSKYPSWKVVTVGIGDAIGTSFGRSMLSVMNFDGKNPFVVGWDELNHIVIGLADIVCNSE